jgi:hypothetical protein
MAKLELHCVDARVWRPGPVAYDVVAAHFFFDCFSSSDVETIVAHVAPALSAEAFWMVSEFAIPPAGFVTPLAWLLVRTLYFAFHVLTGLEVTCLPNHAKALAEVGFAQAEKETGLGGVLRSELWVPIAPPR